MNDNRPNLQHEQAAWSRGYCRVAGIDEAGRGALAGPVVAGAVVVPPNCTQNGVWGEVRDSKLLAPHRRTALAVEIYAQALAAGVGLASAAEIDAIGIAPATRLAMLRAIEALAQSPDYLLIDWVRLPQCSLAQESFAKADRYSVAVAAASILAKTTRDDLMRQADATHPGYGFAAHKGYGAVAHLAALAQIGPCALHRFSFAPIARRASLFDDSFDDSFDGRLDGSDGLAARDEIGNRNAVATDAPSTHASWPHASLPHAPRHG